MISYIISFCPGHYEAPAITTRTASGLSHPCDTGSRCPLASGDVEKVGGGGGGIARASPMWNGCMRFGMTVIRAVHTGRVSMTPLQA